MQFAALWVGFFGREAGGGFGGVGVDAEFFEEDVAGGVISWFLIAYISVVFEGAYPL